ncbi:MAG: hypothetical protein PHT69_02770 [Bacteroidales bacterium]|nr:hypothetical protein [Bacteroidales bacterium]
MLRLTIPNYNKEKGFTFNVKDYLNSNKKPEYTVNFAGKNEFEMNYDGNDSNVSLIRMRKLQNWMDGKPHLLHPDIKDGKTRISLGGLLDFVPYNTLLKVEELSFYIPSGVWAEINIYQEEKN